MHFQLAEDVFAAGKFGAKLADSQAREQFRARFRNAMGICLQKGFLPEECFVLIWEETLEEITLPQLEQRELREELIEWVKAQRNPG